MNLADAVKECVARARILHHIHPDAMEYEPGPPLPIIGDSDEVRAAVSNLIDNAIKYSGVDMHVQVSARHSEGRFAEVRVKDQGPGIPETELKRIFKRFYRIHSPPRNASQRHRTRALHCALRG